MSKTCIRMGLFDGLKDAFSAPALESTNISSERETPIDRWMGWNAMGKDQDGPSSGEYLVKENCVWNESP